MTDQLDLQPAVQRMSRLVAGVPAELLGGPTPCTEYTVGDLLDHIGGAALAFAGAASKRPLPGGPSGDAANLAPDWRTRIQRDLEALAATWAEPSAWTGLTSVGGVELPGEVAGVVALDELVIHGWDLAKATEQDAGYDGPELAAVQAMVQHFRSSGIDGLFGPPVAVADNSSALACIVGLAGRDPEWQPPR